MNPFVLAEAPFFAVLSPLRALVADIPLEMRVQGLAVRTPHVDGFLLGPETFVGVDGSRGPVTDETIVRWSTPTCALLAFALRCPGFVSQRMGGGAPITFQQSRSVLSVMLRYAICLDARRPTSITIVYPAATRTIYTDGRAVTRSLPEAEVAIRVIVGGDVTARFPLLSESPHVTAP